MAVATPKVINNINYRDDDEINVYFSIEQNTDEDMFMYKARLTKLLNNYFSEAKNYKESSIAAQRSKYIGDILKGKLGNKVNHFQTWLNTKRTYWSREMMKKYNNNDNVVERKVITVEVNIDYKEKLEEAEALIKKLKIENDKLRNMNKDLKKGVRIEIEESKEEESKEEESKVEECKEVDPAFNEEKHQPLIIRMNNAKRLLIKSEFQDRHMNMFINGVSTYYKDNDDSDEVVKYVDSYFIELLKHSPYQEITDDFMNRYKKRLATFQ